MQRIYAGGRISFVTIARIRFRDTSDSDIYENSIQYKRKGGGDRCGCVVGSKTSFKKRRRKRPRYFIAISGKNAYAKEETGLLQRRKQAHNTDSDDKDLDNERQT